MTSYNKSLGKVFPIVKSSGIDPSDATATASDILLGKTAYVADGKVTGTYNKLAQVVDATVTELTADDLAGATKIANIFPNIKSLVSISIPNSAASIDSYAFYGCFNLEFVTIEGNTSIGSGAFYSCSKMKSFTIKAITPPTLSDTTAFQSTGNCPIYVPAESVDTYKAATNWSALASRIQAIPE